MANSKIEFDNEKHIATELVLEKLKKANINVITDQSEMQAILEAGIEVQKMAAHYGTNQNIENADSFNGYGVYVLSVNEENARNLGLKIASKKYGNSFYINNQLLKEFLQERSFSPYWQSVISQIQNPSNETLLNSIMTSDVKGNPVLQNEQNQLSVLCSLNLINYKREQTYLYSVEIPDNDGTNYLFYDKTIGLENAERINSELSKLGTNWKVSRNDTGNSVYFNILSDKVFNSQKQASEFLQKAGYVGMETSNENYIIFDDREMNINNRVQYMITENGELYGFAYNGQIYADKNLMNSNVLAHEYTHLWDNYTKNKNPELWESGKNVFKQTSLWNEVINDPSYQNIKNNEDEILSECHARIVGKFAQSVLERIAAENGENAKNAVIDWDKEVNEFVAKEFGFAPELGSENYVSETIKTESMKDFLVAPMKNLMNGVGFEKEYMLNKTSSKPDMQIGKTSISGNSPFFPEEPQLSIGSRANHILLQNDDERQAVIKKLDKIKTEKIEPREFLIKLKEAYNFEDRDSSDYVANRINSSRFALRISNHSVNAHYVEKKYVEISIVIRLSYNEFQDEADKYVAEFNYTPEMLTPEKKHQIVENLKNWTITGQYPETEVKPTYSPNEAEWKKANEKMLEFVNKSKLQKMVFNPQYHEHIENDNDYVDPIEALEESYNTPLNPPTEEDIEAEKILHDKYIQDELDKTIEDLQANGGLSDAAIEAEIAAQEEAEAYEEDSSYDEEEEPVLTFNDTDKETQTFSSEKFSYKFSTDELKEEIPVKKGEIKSILDNNFTGGNIKLTQDFQNELIEKGLVKPEEKFVLINEVEAVAKGTKIKPDQLYVTLTIPVDNNGKTEFVQTKYYHVSSLEEPQKLEKTIDENATQVDKNVIIYGETKVPEFAMITQHGLENFKDMIIDSFEESSGTYLLKSEDGKNNVRVTENTLKTLTSDEYAKKTETYTQDTKTAEKMIDTQYNDFFQPRSNCANNFRHNLAVFCRKEANSPLDAMKVASSLISQMPKEEKQKTKELLNLLRKDGQSVNEVLIETYHDAVKEIPLNEDYIKHNRYEKIIARPMYDTLSTKGEKIDRDFNLKIGDSVDVSFKVDKNPGSKFSLRKESIYQNCTIISASKEGNIVTLMDGNKSFYDVPRDTFLKEYAHKQKVEHKMENKVHRQHSMQISIGR